MININYIKALIKKETLQIFRDPSSILIAIVLPLILLFIYGYGLNLDNNMVRVGIVNANLTRDSVDLARTFQSSKFFDVKFGTSIKEFEQQIIAGKLRGIIVIPQDFERKNLLTNKANSIQVITDGSEPNIASFVRNYAQGLLNTWLSLNDKLGANLIDISSRFWFNQELKSKNFLIPGSLAIIMTLIGTLLTALVIAREWERGTMEALMATPVSVFDIIVSKIIPYYFLGICSMTICFIVSILVYQVPFRGSIILLFIVTSAFLFAALAQGLLISIVAKDQFIASQMALTSAFLPAFMLSGFIFEISSMPFPIRMLTHIFPARYFVTCLQTLFLAGDVMSVIVENVFFLLVMAAVLFFLMSKKMKKEIT